MSIRDLVPWGRRHAVPIRHEGGGADPIRTLHRRIDDLFADFWRDWDLGLTPWSDRGFAPAVDLDESDDELVVHAEVPGMEPGDLDIALADGLLTIRGEKKQEEEGERQGVRYRESRSGSFVRQIPLHVPVDADHVRAEVRNGVLTVRLPKAAEGRAKRIEVQAA